MTKKTSYDSRATDFYGSYTISKEIHFSASHQLTGLPQDHPCSRLHGHNYIYRIELTAPTVNTTGFVLDYRALEPIKKWVDDTLDHHHLNDIFDVNPTAENQARYMVGLVHELVELPSHTRVAVSVSETPKTWATFREGK